MIIEVASYAISKIYRTPHLDDQVFRMFHSELVGTCWGGGRGVPCVLRAELEHV